MNFRKKTAFGILLLLLVIVLMPVCWLGYLRYELNSEKAILAKKGEYMSLRQPWPKPLQGDAHKTAEVYSAMGQLTRGTVLETNQVLLMRPVSFGRAMAGSALPEIRKYGEQTNSWADLAQDLQQNAGALETIRNYLHDLGFDFHLNYALGSRLVLPHLGHVSRSAQAFSMAAALALHNHELDIAATNLAVLLKLSHALHQDRLVISEMVQIGIAHIAATATWEALQTAGWRDEPLRNLQQGWLALSFLPAFQDSLSLDRAMRSDEAESLRDSTTAFAAAFGSIPGMPRFRLSATASPASLASFGGSCIENTRSAILHAWWARFWSLSDEARSLKISQIFMETLREPSPCWQKVQASTTGSLRAHGLPLPPEPEPNGFGFGFQFHLKSLYTDIAFHEFNCVRKAFEAETLKEIVATAIALKRFEMRHGKYPSSLSSLVPEFLPRLPIDPMDGQPLRYRLETDGTFVLYSVGNDGIDDKGQAPPEKEKTPGHWTQQRDWVWPTLASPAEVQAYETEATVKNAKQVLRRRVPLKLTSTNSAR